MQISSMIERDGRTPRLFDSHTRSSKSLYLQEFSGANVYGEKVPFVQACLINQEENMAIDLNIKQHMLLMNLKH